MIIPQIRALVTRSAAIRLRCDPGTQQQSMRVQADLVSKPIHGVDDAACSALSTKC